MARAKSEFRKYVDEAQDLPEDVVLGQIVIYTINDGSYSRSNIEQWFDSLSLNPIFVPPEVTVVDAFNKAASEIDGTKYQVADGVAEVMVRDLTKNKDDIIKQITREVRDSKRQQLSYERVGELVYGRPRSKMQENGKVKVIQSSARVSCRIEKTDPMPPHLPRVKLEEYPQLDALKVAFETHYDRYLNYLDGQKVRGVIRDYLRYLNGVMLKASVYFVHNSRVDELKRLAEFVNMLGNGSTLTLIPMADLPHLRESVIEAFQNEAVKELEEVVRQINGLRNLKTISPTSYAKVHKMYKAVLAKSTEYTRTLQMAQDRTAGEAEVVMDLLADLQRMVLQ